MIAPTCWICRRERRARHTPATIFSLPFALTHPSEKAHISPSPSGFRYRPKPLFSPSFERPTFVLRAHPSPVLSFEPPGFRSRPKPPLPLRHRGVINQGFVPRTAHHTCAVRATGLRSVPPGYRKRPWIFTWPIQPRSQGSRRWPGPAWPGTFSANLQWTSGLAAESSYSPYCW